MTIGGIGANRGFASSILLACNCAHSTRPPGRSTGLHLSDTRHTRRNSMASHVTTRLAVLAGAAFTLAAGVASASPIAYVQTNLSSDISGLAANTDPAMKNPWG